MTRRDTPPATEENAAHWASGPTLEEVATEENLRRAFASVRRNRGAPGPDGQTVDDLAANLEVELRSLRRELLAESLRPGPVRGVEIPKPNGETRQLGIPNVRDRWVQQALAQRLSDHVDPEFSHASFGFRPGKSALMAIEAAVEHLNEGYDQVVNIDLRKFFDTVHHDLVMNRLSRRVEDKRILRVIGRILRAGLMRGGVTSPRSTGVPQGGPLSPLLSNILLDELDKELEERGHRFVRYADDFLIFKRTERSARRTKTSVRRFLENRLKLAVNEEKSGVQRPEDLIYLGYTFVRTKGGIRPLVPEKASRKLRDRLRPELTRYGRGRPLERTIARINPVLRGWANYFRLSCGTKENVRLDKWIRRHLRCLLWRQWGKLRRTRARRLMARGVSPRMAWHLARSRKGPWRISATPQMSIAVPNAYLHDLGLFDLTTWKREARQRG